MTWLVELRRTSKWKKYLFFFLHSPCSDRLEKAANVYWKRSARLPNSAGRISAVVSFNENVCYTDNEHTSSLHHLPVTALTRLTSNISITHSFFHSRLKTYLFHKFTCFARPGNFVSNFCVFWGKTTIYGKIFKILFRKFPGCQIQSNPMWTTGAGVPLCPYLQQYHILI